MESVPCPISGSADFTPWIQVPNRFDPSGKEQWSLLRSTASGLIMLNPRPDSTEIARHYPRGLYEPHLHQHNSTTFSSKAYLAARSLLLRYKARIILRGTSKPLRQVRVLEIGCSTGELLNYFHRHKGIPLQNLAGVESDAEAASHAQQVYSLKVSCSLPNDGGGKFDRIIVWHTLEHIHAIHETLGNAAQQLAAGGMLIIALPNPESYDAKQYQENWIAWDAPRHLYHFVPETLEKLLQQHGLKVVHRQPYPPDAIYNTLHSEKLLCKSEGRGFHAPQLGTALMKGIATASIGTVLPRQASSLVYFVRKFQT